MGLLDFDDDQDQDGPPQNVLQTSAPGLAPTPMAPNAPAPDMSLGGTIDPYNNGGAKPGLLDRILNRVMPTPQAYRGLISPDEMQESRRAGLLNFGTTMLSQSSGQNGGPPPGVGAALGSAIRSGVGAFDANNAGILQQQGSAAQIMQQRKILAVRQQAQQQFAPPQGVPETQQQQLDRQSAQAAFLASNGDYEGAKGIADATAPLRMSRAYAQMGGNGPHPINGVMFDPTVTNNMGTQGGFYNDDLTQAARKINPSAPPVYTLSSPNTQSTADRDQLAAAKAKAEADKSAADSVRANDRQDQIYGHQILSGPAKAYVDFAPKYQNMQASLAQAIAGNPAANNAIPSIVQQIMDPKAQMRGMLFDKLSKPDQSWLSQLAAQYSRGFTGNLPPDQLQHLKTMLDAAGQTNMTAYENIRQSVGKGPRPKAQGYMPQTLTLFGQAPGVPGAQTPGSSAKIKALLGVQ